MPKITFKRSYSRTLIYKDGNEAGRIDPILRYPDCPTCHQNNRRGKPRTVGYGLEVFGRWWRGDKPLPVDAVGGAIGTTFKRKKDAMAMAAAMLQGRF